MKENHQKAQRRSKKNSLRVSLVGDRLLIYRDNGDGSSNTQSDRRVRKKDLFSAPLGDYRINRKQELPYVLMEHEENQIFLLQELTTQQRRALQVTQSVFDLRTKRNSCCSELETLEDIHKLDNDLGLRIWEASDEQELRRKLELFDGEEQRLRRLHDEEALGIAHDEVQLNMDLTNGEPMYAAVFSVGGKLYLCYGAIGSIYNNLLKINIRVKRVHLNQSNLCVDLWLRFENLYDLELSDCSICVGELISRPQTPVVLTKLSTENVQKSKYLMHFTIPTRELADYSLGENSPVKLEGNSVFLTITVNGAKVLYRVKKKAEKKVRFGIRHNAREAWVPTSSVYCDGYALHIRRNFSGIYVLFKREMNPIEHQAHFRFKESFLISFLLFQLGRVLSHIPSRKKVALFFEKRGEKAEEGTYELCKACSDSKRTRCYFVIDENSPDYLRIKGDPCVVRKFSWKYYWLLYNVNYFIAAEAPIHVNMLNSNNRYVRWTCIRHPFIFLQHGITYLKKQGDRSTYIKGKAGECSYIIVSSPKEKKVVSETFRISPDRVWITGMLMFDNCEYKRMTQASEDKITIMLTWKPYEETLDNFEDSTYYKYTLQVYEMLLKYVDRSQINVVAHPRAYDLLKSTSLHDLVWDKPISEVLRESKLLITDYSSVCWNSFYQGGGVIFFQPDLEEYEAYVGTLIPDADEYIGPRVFDMQALEEQFQNGLKNSSVDLSYFRNKHYEEVYQSINQFHDGKNTERVKKMLKKNKFI